MLPLRVLLAFCMIFSLLQLRKCDSEGHGEENNSVVKRSFQDGLCRLDGYCHACDSSSGCCRCADGGCDCYDDDDDGDSGCFPATARISLQGGESVSMAELQVGDKVQSVLPDGSATFSEVRAFLHRSPDVTGSFKVVATSVNKTISLTGDHLIYARSTSKDKFQLIFADAVSENDEILLQDGALVIPVKVKDVSALPKQGLYAPLTAEGNIVVDGILASCNASVDHSVAHVAMAIMRWVPGALEWIFGADHGFSAHVKLGLQLGHLLLPETYVH